MDGEANWIMGMIMVFGGVGIALLVAYSKAAFERFKAQKADLSCPETGEPVKVIVESDLTHRKPMQVVCCSRLDDPCDVHCHMGCLRQMPS